MTRWLILWIEYWMPFPLTVAKFGQRLPQQTCIQTVGFQCELNEWTTRCEKNTLDLKNQCVMATVPKCSLTLVTEWHSSRFDDVSCLLERPWQWYQMYHKKVHRWHQTGENCWYTEGHSEGHWQMEEWFNRNLMKIKSKCKVLHPRWKNPKPNRGWRPTAAEELCRKELKGLSGQQQIEHVMAACPCGVDG